MRLERLVGFLCLGLSCLAIGSGQPVVARQRHQDLFLAGVPAFTSVQDLPYLRTGVQTHQFTSYDRAGDNYDADYFPLYTESDGACVLFDVYGPGCLYRLHANLWNGDLGGVNIRFYFDDEVKPRIDMDVTKFFSPQNPLGIFYEPYAHIGGGYRFVY